MNENLNCPNCGSNELSKPKWSRQALAITILLIGFPLPFMSKEVHCFDCGLNFKLKRKNMR
jgi:transcription elongation factor Elf1